MSNVIAIDKKSFVKKHDSGKTTVQHQFGEKATFILIIAMFIIGTMIAVIFGIPIKAVMAEYSYDVLALLIVMELFTYLIAETGIMQLLAIKIAEMSKGRKRLCLMLFSTMLFFISSCLNNITAVLVVLPVIFVLLKTLEVDKKYVCIFFAAILALSNTGGAASPVGDFPAIVIMTSGITDFPSYLTHAFPLFAMTSVVLIVVWGMQVEKENDDGAIRQLAIQNLKSQYKNTKIRFDVLKWLLIVFVCMFLAWSFVPQEMIPPEIIAVLGYAAAMMPIIIQICNGPLSGQSDWIAVAYAASICAGSSMFMWSATAGFILSGKVNSAGITEDGKKVNWGIGQYLKYGVINYSIQILIALSTMAVIL